MFYTVYKTTNRINGKFYIGTHKTEDLDDGYLGSGKLLQYAINKYGSENFTKEILWVFDNPEDMFLKERELVTEEFLSEENTYNLKIGGFGGWDYNNSPEGQKLREFSYPKWIREGNKAFVKKYHSDSEFRKQHNKKLIKNSKKAFKVLKEKYPKGTFFGKSHSEETKKIMSEKAKLRTGKLNSQYGTMWITNGIDNRKIKKEESIPEGWDRGRTISSVR